jgi:hypothetical protein
MPNFKPQAGSLMQQIALFLEDFNNPAADDTAAEKSDSDGSIRHKSLPGKGKPGMYGRR